MDDIQAVHSMADLITDYYPAHPSLELRNIARETKECL
jgi:hypothetical protein